MESLNSFSDLQIPDPVSEVKVKVLRDVMPPEGAFGLVPLIEKPILRVVKVDEVGTAVGPSGLASPS